MPDYRPLTAELVHKAQGVYRSGPLAKAVFDTLASRLRPRDTTDVTRLKVELVNEQGMTVPWDRLLSVFSRLEALGVCEGMKKKKPTDHYRVAWHYNYLELMRRVVGKKPVLPDAPLPPHVMVKPFQVSARLVLNIRLPKDIRPEELRELAKQLQAFAQEVKRPAEPSVLVI